MLYSKGVFTGTRQAVERQSLCVLDANGIIHIRHHSAMYTLIISYLEPNVKHFLDIGRLVTQLADYAMLIRDCAAYIKVVTEGDIEVAIVRCQH